MKILIVDDSESFRSIMKKMLQDMGHETIEAVHGKEALAQLEAHPDIGLITLDWNMPEMNGIELLTVLMERNQERPNVMMVTRENEMDKIASALTKGAHEYIMKPFTKEILEEKLAILGIKSTSRT